MNDDKLLQAASRLETDISPERDLWSGIADAIEKPAPRRLPPMLAQAAVLALLVGTSSLVTYMAVKDTTSTPVIGPPEMVFEQASFGERYNLGPGFQDARNALLAELDVEMQRLSPEARENVEANLRLINVAVDEMNSALTQNPENLLLQEQLLRTYREELMLLRRVSGLTRNVMLRNDI